MADFLTRLAERTLGVAPVVRPLVPPRFAPEAAPYPLDLEREVEAPPPDEPEETRAPRTREAPPRRNAQARRTGGTTSGRREDRDAAPPEPASPPDEEPTPTDAPLPDPPPDTRPDAAPPRPAATAAARDDADWLRPPAEKRGDPLETETHTRSEPSEEERAAPDTTPGRTGEPVEIRSSEEEPSPVAPGRPRRTAGPQPETGHPREAGRERDEGVAPRRGARRDSPVAPSAPVLGASHPADPVVELAERVRSIPRVVPELRELPASEASAHTRAIPDPSLAAPRTVGDVADARPRRGSPGPSPPEAPPIKVSIGRVEVRAVPPAPAPPRRQDTPPAGLSLDDYLLSRDGERR